MPFFNRIPQPITVEELLPIVEKLQPEIGMLGGRFFKDPNKNVHYSLNTIIKIFENTIRNPMNSERQEKASKILAKIRQLDKEGDILLEREYDSLSNESDFPEFLILLLATTVRRIGNLFFFRTARLEKIEKKIAEPALDAAPAIVLTIPTPKTAVPQEQRIDNAAQGHPTTQPQTPAADSAPAIVLTIPSPGAAVPQEQRIDDDNEDDLFHDALSSTSESDPEEDSFLQRSLSSDSLDSALSEDEASAPAQPPIPSLQSAKSSTTSSQEVPAPTPPQSPEPVSPALPPTPPLQSAQSTANSSQEVSAPTPPASPVGSSSSTTNAAPRSMFARFTAMLGFVEPVVHPMTISISSFEMIPDSPYERNLYFLMTLNEEDERPIGIKDGLLTNEENQPSQENLGSELQKMNDLAFNDVETALGNVSDTGTKENFKALRIAIDNELAVYKGIQQILANSSQASIVDAVDAVSKQAKARIEVHFIKYDEIINLNQNTGVLSASFIRAAHVRDKEIASNLKAFCSSWGNEISVETAQSYIDKGKVLIGQIMDGTKTDGKEEDLLHLTWFLMAQGIKKGQGYQEGAFMIEDRNKKLYNFLLKSQGENASTSYVRPSTHFKGRTDQQYGLDVFHQDMPCKKRTLLFGMIDNKDSSEQVLFIKPENFSAYVSVAKFYDAWYHGWEMIVAQKNKLLYEGLDDAENMRKERVPTEVTKEFVKLIKLLRKNPGFDYKAVHSDAKKYGISFMNGFIDNLQEKPAGFDPSRFKSLIRDYDHLEARTGREVYLTAQEL